MKSQYTIDLIGRLLMLLRRSPVRVIARQLKRCKSLGIPMNPETLEAHSLMRGDVVDLVDGLLYAKENKMKGSLDDVAVRQLISAEEGKSSVVIELKEMVNSGILHLDHDLYTEDAEGE